MKPGLPMSPDEQALLAAVAANPADDLPRLVYADWLEEHGQSVRAEFIRLQCEIAKLEKARDRAEMNRNVPLWRRQQDLLEHHLPELLGPGREELAALKPRFDRGFVTVIDLPVEAFIAHGTAVCALVPAPRVIVVGVARSIGSFLACPREQLDYVTDIVLQARDFTVARRLPAFVVAEIRRSSDWPRLSVLNAEACQLGDDGVDHLIREGAFPALTELDVSRNDLTDMGVTNLLDSGVPQHLRRLILGGNPITDQGAFEIADRLARNTRLEVLNLRFTDIGRAGQAALLAAFPKGQVQLF